MAVKLAKALNSLARQALHSKQLPRVLVTPQSLHVVFTICCSTPAEKGEEKVDKAKTDQATIGTEALQGANTDAGWLEK